ncbi:MAG: HK97 gp10 family phage protein [Betaproteobacteria bacterium]|nr:HK97 gp10 family phage protein [Betaproteobacteria bacterium]
MEVTIQLQGFAELAAALKTLPDNIARNALRSAVAAGAAEVRVAAKANALAMRDTGTLARSIYQKQIRELSSLQRQTFYVGARKGKNLQAGRTFGKQGSKTRTASMDAYYARWVEFGHFSRPSGGGRIPRGAGRAAVTSSSAVHWIPPHPFLRPAFDSRKGAAIEAMARKLRDRLERFKVHGK